MIRKEMCSHSFSTAYKLRSANKKPFNLFYRRLIGIESGCLYLTLTDYYFNLACMFQFSIKVKSDIQYKIYIEDSIILLWANVVLLKNMTIENIHLISDNDLSEIRTKFVTINISDAMRVISLVCGVWNVSVKCGRGRSLINEIVIMRLWNTQICWRDRNACVAFVINIITTN